MYCISTPSKDMRDKRMFNGEFPWLSIEFIWETSILYIISKAVNSSDVDILELSKRQCMILWFVLVLTLAIILVIPKILIKAWITSHFYVLKTNIARVRPSWLLSLIAFSKLKNLFPLASIFFNTARNSINGPF